MNGIIASRTASFFLVVILNTHSGGNTFYNHSTFTLTDAQRIFIPQDDTTPPTVNWTSPVTDGNTYPVISGSILLGVNATDDEGVARVHFIRYDAVLEEWVDIGDDYDPPYQIEILASSLNFGLNQINAQAIDTSGNGSNYPHIFINRIDPSFAKDLPPDGETNTPPSLTLSWWSSSGIDSYEYCIDTMDNDLCDTTWTNVGLALSVEVSGLQNGTTYFWQVRAVYGSESVEANGGTWWSFATETPTAITVSVESVWTTDLNGVSKTSFYPGDDIRYLMRVNNTTGLPASAFFEWEVSGPGGSILNRSEYLETDAGTANLWIDSTIDASIPGEYTFTGSVTYDGVTTSQTIPFSLVFAPTVNKTYLPLVSK